MQRLTEEETLCVKGGGISGWAIAGLAAGIIFLLGCFNGYTNPEKCHS